MKKAIAIIILFLACRMACDIDITTAAATGNTLRALDANNKPVTLYECETKNGSRILLEKVRQGKTYIVIVDTFGTFEKEDDLIITHIEL